MNETAVFSKMINLRGEDEDIYGDNCTDSIQDATCCELENTGVEDLNGL